MAPTTRAAAKRGRNKPLGGDTSGESGRRCSKRTRRGIQSKGDLGTGYLTDDRCRLLELPPELRNRIYDFASENHDSLEYAPRPTTLKPVLAWGERAWKYFGLMYVCRQIRAEYRPLWLRSLSMLASAVSIKYFMATFFRDVGDLKYAPKRVQIEWESGQDDLEGYDHDLTAILRMHVHSPGTEILFVPWKVAFGYNRSNDHCWFCINEIEAHDRGEEDYENIVEECTCAPEEMGPEDWVPYQYQLIKRTDILKKIILNNTPGWLDAIRSNSIKVEATFGKKINPISIRILCKDRFFGFEVTDVSTHAENAWNLLQTWGMFDLPSQGDMAFVVAFELKLATRKGDRIVTSKEVREVTIWTPGSAAT